jgi:Type II CAAX prenyl endopeptidase Rce1-like
MAENSSVLFSVGQPGIKSRSRLGALDTADLVALLQVVAGFALIMATVWTVGPLQRRLFWVSAAWYSFWAVVSLWQRRRDAFRMPSAKVVGLLLFTAFLFAGGLVAGAAGLGTLHGLFGTRDPLRHATGYLVWAIIQQYIQQMFFFARFEQIMNSGVMASFTAALLFGIAHLPNPVLAPVTFLGGWLLSELFRRHRTVLPLGVGHGLIGIAIAVSVPDHIQHHMRVGLSYLHYIG